MLATYCLFTAGSIFILKMLKKNKKFYFKTRNFISVSNLMYRMKHNAAGLASICVLSTGVIILLTCGSSLLMLGEKNINDRYPNDIRINTQSTGGESEQTYKDAVEAAAGKAGISTSEIIYRQYKSTVARKNKDALEHLEKGGALSLSDCVDLYFVSIEDYNRYTGSDQTLTDGEALVYYSDQENSKDTWFQLFGKEYHSVGNVNMELSHIIDPTMSLFERMVVVLSKENMDHILDGDFYCEDTKAYDIYIGFDTKTALDQSAMNTFASELHLTDQNCEVHFKVDDRTFFFNIYGGAFFVGIFLAALFLMATVMIIYYKQMAEGYEDQKRFEILSKVGLTEKEAKATIRQQVMILFFLPVVAAMVHAVVASRVIRLFLRMVLIVDAATFFLSIVVVCAVFLVVYVIVYKITSGQYYKIVYGELS